MTKNLFIGGVGVVTGCVIVSLVGALGESERLWRLGILGILAGMTMLVISAVILQRATKRDAGLIRDRTLRIRQQTGRIARTTKHTDHTVHDGALSYLPGQAARTEQAAKRLEVNLREMRSDWSDLIAATATDLEALRLETRTLHELALANIIENRQELQELRVPLEALTKASADSHSRLEAVVAESQSRLEAVANDSQSRLRQILEGEKSFYTYLRHSLDDHYRQIESLLALGDLLEDLKPIPALRDWAASPDLARFLVEHVLAKKPQQIVEIGSGSSTVLMAAAARANGTGHVTAIEHLSQFAQKTNDELKAAHLQDWATVIASDLAPVRIGKQMWTWYDVAATDIPDPIDVLLVDGPPQSTGENARYPALPILREQMADGSIVILDDFNRPQEAVIADIWLEQFPELSLTTPIHEKGTAVLKVNAISTGEAD